MVSKYESGLTVCGKHPIETVEWLFEDSESHEKKIVFLAYDANLCPLPDFSEWKDEEYKQKQIDAALEFTKDFDGEVWLDDVRIK